MYTHATCLRTNMLVTFPVYESMTKTLPSLKHWGYKMSTMVNSKVINNVLFEFHLSCGLHVPLSAKNFSKYGCTCSVSTSTLRVLLGTDCGLFCSLYWHSTMQLISTNVHMETGPNTHTHTQQSVLEWNLSELQRVVSRLCQTAFWVCS